MEQINKKKLVLNFFSLSLVQGINALLQLLIVPFIIAKIGVENFGVAGVAQVVMFFLGTLAEYGFGQAGSREVALYRSDKKRLSALFFGSIYTKIFLCLVAFVLLLLLSVVFPVIKNHFALYCMAFLYVPGQASLPSWFFQGMEKLHWAALSTLFSKIIFVSLVFVFIKGPGDTALFTFFLGLGNLVIGAAATVFVIKKFALHSSKFSFSKIIHTLRDAWPITFSNLTMNFMQYGNLFLLRLFTNDLVAGYFSVAERIYFAMKQVLTAFSQTIYSNICQVSVQGGPALKKYFNKIFRPFLLLTTISSLLTAILAPYIIHFFIHEHNSDAVFVLRMLCVAVPVVCLNIPGSLSLLALNKTKRYFLIYTTGFILCIVANIVLVPLYGPTGTILSVYTTELFITTCTVLALMKIFKTPAA
jgi:PST family polysaccharide transporter